jgi:hypothetical protein
MKQQLQAGSHFGFIGLEMMFDNHLNYPRIGLHSCHGLFWGCIPDDAPALLMHTGHKRTHLAWIQHRMLAALHRWISLQEQQQQGDVVPEFEAVSFAATADARLQESSSSSSNSSLTGDEVPLRQQHEAATEDDYSDDASYISSNEDDASLDAGSDADLVLLDAASQLEDYAPEISSSSSSSGGGGSEVRHWPIRLGTG